MVCLVNSLILAPLFPLNLIPNAKSGLNQFIALTMPLAIWLSPARPWAPLATPPRKLIPQA